MINHEIYLPVLKEFAEKTKGIFEVGYPHGVFVPYVFDKYMDAGLKIFYMGQDTMWWMEEGGMEGKDFFVKYRDDNDLDGYLEKNASLVTPETIFGWNDVGNTAAFWTIVQKLHCYIKQGSYPSKLSAADNATKSIIREIGYGNMNSIELQKSLGSEGCWEDLDKSAYKKVKEAATKISSLDLLMKAYEPDIIFILSGAEYYEQFEGLKLHYYEEFGDENIDIIGIEGRKTKIVHTYHPTSFHHKGYSDIEILDKLKTAADFIQKL